MLGESPAHLAPMLALPFFSGSLLYKKGETSQCFKTQQREFWLRQLQSHVSRGRLYLQLLVVYEWPLRLAPFLLFAFEDRVWSAKRQNGQQFKQIRMQSFN